MTDAGTKLRPPLKVVDFYLAVRDRDGVTFQITDPRDVLIAERDGHLQAIPLTDLVTLSDICRMFDPTVSLSTVFGWATRVGDFPRPVHLGHSGERRWVANEVAAWHRHSQPYGATARKPGFRVGTLRPEWAAAS